MQKIFNLMALLSFLVSGTSVAGAWYLYKNTDTLIEDAREKIVKEIAESLPKIVEELMPDIPEVPTMTGDDDDNGPDGGLMTPVYNPI